MKLLLLLLLPAMLALKPVEVSLPDEEPMIAGPDADLLNRNCVACHSAEMILTQPRMTEDQWKHSVEKMRKVYKAPVDDTDAALLPAALVRLQQTH